MSCYSVVWGVDFSVARRAIIDLCGAGVLTSGCTTSCTSCMTSVDPKTFSGVSQISSSCTLLLLDLLEIHFL
jgi:hypothetical protein